MDKKHLKKVLDALPDPTFILSRSGKYVAIWGGRDKRYYHDSSSLVGQFIQDVVPPEKSQWFLERINDSLNSPQMLIVEYELSRSDIKGIPPLGPEQPVYFEGRIQPLDFTVDGEPVVLWAASNISDRHQLELSLRKLSDTDPLTGLFNRRKLESEMMMHFANFTRYQIPTALLMLDLDNFKSINDRNGHDAGDKVLTMLADVCRDELREQDIACRFGGDEFVLVLPNTESGHAEALAKRLHQRFTNQIQEFREASQVIGLSLGVASFTHTDKNHEDAIKRADQRLYTAKKNGKNKIALDSPAE